MWHNRDKSPLNGGPLKENACFHSPNRGISSLLFIFIIVRFHKNKKDTNNDSQSFVLCLFICWDMCYIAIYIFFYQSCSCHLIHIYIYICVYVALSSCSLAFSMELGTTMVHPNHYSHTQMKDANSSCPIPIFFIKKKLPPNDRTNIHINNNKL